MKVTINASEYAELLRRDYKLDVLEADGVDNWTWYGEGFDDTYWEIMDDYTDVEVIKTLGGEYDLQEESGWIDIKETIEGANTGHWEDDVWSLEEYGYSVKKIDTEIMSTDTVRHIYRFKKGLMVYTFAIVVYTFATGVKSGHVKDGEDGHIVNIYEVFPVPIKGMSWEKK